MCYSPDVQSWPLHDGCVQGVGPGAEIWYNNGKVQYDKKLNLLHLNPGAAGKYGFHTIRTMLRFELDKGEIKNLEIIELATKT